MTLETICETPFIVLKFIVRGPALPEREFGRPREAALTGIAAVGKEGPSVDIFETAVMAGLRDSCSLTPQQELELIKRLAEDVPELNRRTQGRQTPIV